MVYRCLVRRDYFITFNHHWNLKANETRPPLTGVNNVLVTITGQLSNVSRTQTVRYTQIHTKSMLTTWKTTCIQNILNYYVTILVSRCQAILFFMLFFLTLYLVFISIFSSSLKHTSMMIFFSCTLDIYCDSRVYLYVCIELYACIKCMQVFLSPFLLCRFLSFCL